MACKRNIRNHMFGDYTIMVHNRRLGVFSAMRYIQLQARPRKLELFADIFERRRRGHGNNQLRKSNFLFLLLRRSHCCRKTKVILIDFSILTVDETFSLLLLESALKDTYLQIENWAHSSVIFQITKRSLLLWSSRRNKSMLFYLYNCSQCFWEGRNGARTQEWLHSNSPIFAAHGSLLRYNSSVFSLKWIAFVSLIFNKCLR